MSLDLRDFYKSLISQHLEFKNKTLIFDPIKTNDLSSVNKLENKNLINRNLANIKNEVSLEITHINLEELNTIASQLSEWIREVALIKNLRQSPLIILFDGEPGAGKTTFIRNFCNRIGVAESVQSPTYALHLNYNAPEFEVNHFDLYRIEDDESELETINFWEILNIRNQNKNQIILIEWAQRLNTFFNLTDYIQDQELIFKIEIYKNSEDSRSIKIKHLN